jgi:hypothetical protein
MSFIENTSSLSPQQPSEPSADWGLEKLAAFVREAGVESSRLEVECLKIGSSILRLHFDRGKALVVIRDEVLGRKRQSWSRFRKENGFVGTTYDDDIRLFESAQMWEEISAMGLTEARIYLGVTKPKVRKEAEPVNETIPANLPAATESDESQVTPILAAIDKSAGDAMASGKIVHTALSSAALSLPVSGSVAPLNGPPDPEETLFKIIRRLELLEREVQGQVVEGLLPLIDQAVEVLDRLRDISSRKEMAA